MPISRRRLVAGTAFLAALAPAALTDTVSRVLDQTRAFFELLDPEKRAAATFRFGASGLLDDCLAALSGKAASGGSGY